MISLSCDVLNHLSRVLEPFGIVCEECTQFNTLEAFHKWLGRSQISIDFDDCSYLFRSIRYPDSIVKESYFQLDRDVFCEGVFCHVMASMGLGSPFVKRVIRFKDINFIVFEEIKGKRLSSWLCEKERTLPDKIEVFLNLVKKVQEMHGLGIVNKDLSSSSIWVKENSLNPVLMRFNVSNFFPKGVSSSDISDDLYKLSFIFFNFFQKRGYLNFLQNNHETFSDISDLLMHNFESFKHRFSYHSLDVVSDVILCLRQCKYPLDESLEIVIKRLRFLLNMLRA